MTRIFISYDRSDDKFVRRVVDDLRANGLDIWLDVDNVPVGVEWEAVINTAMKQCDTLLLVVSPDSMENPNVEHQWNHFLRHNKPIIPLCYRAAELPTALKHLQPIDFQASSLTKRDTLTDSYQLALCTLQTRIFQRTQPTTNSIVASPRHSNFGSWMPVLAALVIGGVVLSAIFAPIVTNTQQLDQQQSAPVTSNANNQSAN